MPKLYRKSSESMFLGFCVMIIGFALIIFFGNPSLELLGIETRFIPFVLPVTNSGALILLIGFNVLPAYGLQGIVVVKFIIQFLFNNWYATYLSFKFIKWPVHL